MSGKGIRVNKYRTNAPCLHCEDRVPGCHGNCERYKLWRAPFLKAREERIKINEADGITIDRIRREKKEKHGKG